MVITEQNLNLSFMNLKESLDNDILVIYKAILKYYKGNKSQTVEKFIRNKIYEVWKKLNSDYLNFWKSYHLVGDNNSISNLIDDYSDENLSKLSLFLQKLKDLDEETDFNPDELELYKESLIDYLKELEPYIIGLDDQLMPDFLIKKVRMNDYQCFTDDIIEYLKEYFEENDFDWWQNIKKVGERIEEIETVLDNLDFHSLEEIIIAFDQLINLSHTSGMFLADYVFIDEFEKLRKAIDDLGVEDTIKQQKEHISESLVTYIFENIDKIYKYYKNKIDYDTFVWVLKQSPDYNEKRNSIKKIGKWLIEAYINSSEDKRDKQLPEVIKYLEDIQSSYIKYKDFDIWKYKNFDNFLAEVKKFENKPDYYTLQDLYATLEISDEKEREKAYQDIQSKLVKQIKTGKTPLNAIKKAENDEWEVWQPLDEPAACYLGRKSHWCFAANSTNNLFNTYSPDKGLLLIFKNKDNLEDSYALFIKNEVDINDQSIEFKDFADQPYSFYDFIELNPDIIDKLKEKEERLKFLIAKEFMDNYDIDNYDREELNNFLKNTIYLDEKEINWFLYNLFDDLSDRRGELFESVEDVIDFPVLEQLAKKVNLNFSFLHFVKNYSEELKDLLLIGRSLSPEKINIIRKVFSFEEFKDKVLKTDSIYSYLLLLEAFGNRLSLNDLKVIFERNKDKRFIAQKIFKRILSSKIIDEDLIRKVYKVIDPSLYEELIKNPATPPDIIRDIYSKVGEIILDDIFIGNPSTPSDILIKLKPRYFFSYEKLYEHRNFPLEELINRYKETTDHTLKNIMRTAIIDRKDIPINVLKDLIKNDEDLMDMYVFEKAKYPDELKQILFNKVDKTNTKEEFLRKVDLDFINKNFDKISQIYYDDIISRPDLSKELLNKIFNQKVNDYVYYGIRRALIDNEDVSFIKEKNRVAEELLDDKESDRSYIIEIIKKLYKILEDNFYKKLLKRYERNKSIFRYIRKHLPDEVYNELPNFFKEAINESQINLFQIYNLIEEYILENTDKVYQYFKDKIEREEFDYIISLSPDYNKRKNSVGRLGKWLISAYINSPQYEKGKLEEVINYLKEIKNSYIKYKDLKLDQLKTFDQFLNKIKEFENKPDYYTLNDLYVTLEIPDKEEREKAYQDMQKKLIQQVKTGKTPLNINKIYEDDEWFIAQPLDEPAACLLGRGSRWCFASNSTRNAFKTNYNPDEGLLLVFRNKKNPEKSYALFNRYRDKISINSIDVANFSNDMKNPLSYIDDKVFLEALSKLKNIEIPNFLNSNERKNLNFIKTLAKYFTIEKFSNVNQLIKFIDDVKKELNFIYKGQILEILRNKDFSYSLLLGMLKQTGDNKWLSELAIEVLENKNLFEKYFKDLIKIDNPFLMDKLVYLFPINKFPKDYLLKIIKYDLLPDVIIKIIKNLPEKEILEAASKSKYKEVKETILLYDNLSDDVFKNLIRYGDESIRISITKKIDLSEDIIRELANDKNVGVKEWVARRSDLPEDLIRQLAQDKDSNVRWNIARRDDLSEDLIRQLAKDRKGSVRAIISKKDNLPEDLIRKFAKDRDRDVRKNIAQRNDLPADLIEQLAQDKDEYVRENIARRNDLSEDIIKLLAKDKDEDVRQTIAKKDNLPEDIIRQLAKDERYFVKRYAIDRDNLPEDFIRELAQDKDNSIREIISGRDDLPKDVIRQLAKNGNYHIKLNIAEKDNLPEDVIRLLAQDKNRTIRVTIAEKDNLPEDVIRLLAQDKSVKNIISTNPNLPKDLMKKFANSGDISLIKSLIDNPNLSEDIIKQLAQSENKVIREALARRKDLPEEIIRILAKNTPTSRNWLARNSNLPEDLIREFVRNGDTKTKTQIALRRDLPEDVIEQLMEERDFVKSFLAENPTLPEKYVRQLAEIDDEQIKASLARRANLPEDLINQLAEDESDSIRLTIAERDDLSIDLIRKLSQDRDSLVRREIAKKDNLPEDVISNLMRDTDSIVRYFIKQKKEKIKESKITKFQNILKEFLFENLDDIYKYFKDKIDRETFDQIIKQAPDYNEKKDKVGKFGRWLINAYIKSPENERDSQLDQIINYLKEIKNSYIKYKNLNLDKLKTFDDFLKEVEKFKNRSDYYTEEDLYKTLEIPDEKEREKAYQDMQKKLIQQVKTGKAPFDIDKLYEDDEWYVAQPYDEPAACILGRGSKWCFASNSTRNEFRTNYNPEKGFLLIFRNKKNPKKSYALFSDYNESDFAYSFYADFNDNINYISELKNLPFVKIIPKLELPENIKAKAFLNFLKTYIKAKFEPELKEKDFKELFNKTNQNIVFEALINRPDIPEKLLKLLAKHKSDYIRNLVAEKRFISSEIIRMLAKDSNKVIRFTIAKRNNLPEDVIKLLAKDSDNYIVSTIARKDDLPEDVLEYLVRNKNEEIKEIIVEKNNLPESIIRLLAKDENHYIKLSISERNDLPEDVIRQLAQDKSLFIRLNISKKDNLPEDLIRQLAQNENFIIRLNIAKKDNLPEDLIRQLAQDEDKNVREAIAKKDNLPEDLIRQLAQDKNKKVRKIIAKRNDLPEDVIRQLAKDKITDVKLIIASKYELPEDLIRELAKDKNIDVRSIIAKRDDLPEDVVRQLMNDKSLYIRNIIKRNPLSKKLQEKRIFEELIYESLDNLYRNFENKIDRETFDWVIKQAPDYNPKKDRVGKLGRWLINAYIRTPDNERDSQLEEVINYLREIKQSYIKYKDLNLDKLRTFDDFLKEVRRFENKKDYYTVDDLYATLSISDEEEREKAYQSMQKKLIQQIKTGKTPLNVNKIYEDSEWFVAQPLDEPAACLLGRGSEWCFSSNSVQNAFKSDYDPESGFLLIFRNKKNPKNSYAFFSTDYSEDINDTSTANFYDDVESTQYYLESYGDFSDVVSKLPDNYPSIEGEIIRKLKLYNLILNNEKSDSLIRKLIQTEESDVREFIAGIENLPEDVIRQLAHDEDYNVRRKIFERDDLPEDIIRELLKEDDIIEVDTIVKINIAKRANLPLDIIRLLAKDKESSVREAIAERDDLPEDIIKQLVKDEFWIRETIAKKRNLPENIVRLLAKDEYEGVREIIAQREDLPEDIVRQLAQDRNSDVRHFLSFQKNLPEDVVRLLAQDKSDSNTRRNIAERDDLPEDVIRLLAKDSNEYVRKEIAKKDNLPEDVIKELAQDESENIRKTIIQKLKKQSLQNENVIKHLKEILLFENLDDIYKNFENKIDRETFDEIIKQAPDYNSKKDKVGKLGRWLINAYVSTSENERDSQLDQVLSYLKEINQSYIKYKNLNLDKLKTFDDFLSEVEKFKNKPNYYTVDDLYATLNIPDGKERKKAYQNMQSKLIKQIKTGKTPLNINKIYEDDEWYVAQPLDEPAACILGRGSGWCFAANSTNNEFRTNYNPEKGYLIIFRNKKDPEKSYAFFSPQYTTNILDTITADYFDDVKDTDFYLTEPEFYSVVLRLPDINGKEGKVISSLKNFINLNFVKYYLENYDILKLPREILERFINAKDRNILWELSRINLPEEVILDILNKDILYNKSPYLLITYIEKVNHLPRKVIERIINSKTMKRNYVCKKILETHKLPKDLVLKVFKRAINLVDKDMLLNTDLPDNLLRQVFYLKNNEIKKLIIDKKNPSEDLLKEFFQKGNRKIKKYIAEKPDISENLIRYMAKIGSSIIKRKLAKRDDLPKDVVKLLKEEGYII